jgi:uncharacterized protein YbjQ (UPF0145 family)
VGGRLQAGVALAACGGYRSGAIQQERVGMIVATTNDLPGYRVTEQLGVVRGITVRSRSVIGNIGGAIQSVFGGNITIYTELAEKARQEAYNLMVDNGRRLGADAIIAMRYDANEIMDGITEVLAYGTAVKAEKL